MNQFLTDQSVELYKKSFARAIRTFAFTESFDGEILRNIDFLTKHTLQPEKKSGKRDCSTTATIRSKKKQNKSLKKQKKLFRQKIFAIYLDALNELIPLEKGFSQLEISPFIYIQKIKPGCISPLIRRYLSSITKSKYIFEKTPREYPFFVGKSELLFHLLPDILKKLPLKEKDQKDLKNLEKLSAISKDSCFLQSYQVVRSKTSVEIFKKFKEKLSELLNRLSNKEKEAEEIFKYITFSNSVVEKWEKVSTVSSVACFVLLQESPPILDLLHMMYLVYKNPLKSSDVDVLSLKEYEKRLQTTFPDQKEDIEALSVFVHFLEIFELFSLETLSRLNNLDQLPFSKLPKLLERKMNVEDLNKAKTNWTKSIKQNPLFDIWIKESKDRKTYQQVLDAEGEYLKNLRT